MISTRARRFIVPSSCVVRQRGAAARARAHWRSTRRSGQGGMHSGVVPARPSIQAAGSGSGSAHLVHGGVGGHRDHRDADGKVGRVDDLAHQQRRKDGVDAEHAQNRLRVRVGERRVDDLLALLEGVAARARTHAAPRQPRPTQAPVKSSSHTYRREATRRSHSLAGLEGAVDTGAQHRGVDGETARLAPSHQGAQHPAVQPIHPSSRRPSGAGVTGVCMTS
jgi:hypothetical protein